jgi:hypothetical protein
MGRFDALTNLDQKPAPVKKPATPEVTGEKTLPSSPIGETKKTRSTAFTTKAGWHTGSRTRTSTRGGRGTGRRTPSSTPCPQGETDYQTTATL